MAKLDIQPLDIQPLDIKPLDIRPIEEKTFFGEDVDIGIAGLKNLVDTTGSLAAHTLSRIGTSGGDESILEELDKRRKQRVQESNPKQKKQGIGGALTSSLVQIPGMVLGPAPVGINTAVDFIDRGETLEKAALAGGVDAALQTLGITLPLVGKTAAQKIIGNVLVNPAQGALSDAAVAAIADKAETKAAYDWTNPERRVADAVMGGGLGAIASIRKPQVIDDPNNRLNSIKPSVEDTTQSGTPAFKFNKRLDINLDDGVNAPEVFRVDGMGNQAEAYHPTFETEVARVAAMDRMIEALDAEVAKPPGISNTGRGPASGGISPELLTFGLSNLFNKKQPKFLDDILNTKLYAEAVSGDDVVKAALAEGPEKPSNVLTRATTNMGSGGTMEAAKRNSTAILGSSRIVQRAKNIAEDNIRSTIFPVENSLRQAKKSIEHLAAFLKREQVGKELLGEKALADEGADLKAVAAYSQLRNMQKTTGDYINNVLSSLGKRSIELDPAYMTSIWKGDFKTIFYRELTGEDGTVIQKPVAAISADTKLGLKQQLKAFKKQNPDLANLKTEDATVKGPGRQGSDFTRIFNTMLEVLGENDPAMQKVAAWAEMNTEMQSRKMLGEQKHFIPKTGVIGYVGDRPSNTIFGGFNNKKEALAYLQAQVDVAKAAYQWGEMQKAAVEMKKILSNEELAAQQPHNMRFVRDYWLDNLGMTDSAVASAIDDTVLRKWVGVSPGATSNVINHIKSFWISQKILGAPYYIANGIQYLNVIPHLTDMSVKWGGNPIYAVSSGMMDGLLTALGHMAHTLKGSDDIKPNLYRIAAQGGLSEFSIKAMKYAEDNSVTTRSIYDEAPIESSIGVLGPAKRITTGLISTPETFLRSFAYMTYAHMLKSSGKFTNDMDVFRMAEERVNRSMGDYRTGERALMFGKMGTVGTAANTLTTFPMNYFNNWSWAAREAGRGNMLPFVAMFATQFLAAGAMGIPGFADMDKIWEWIKGTQKDDPETWDKIKDIDLQEIARSFGGDLGLYGLPSVLTDTALTSRAAAPLGTEMVQTPGAPFADVARQVSSVLNAAMDPTNPQKAGQALYNISPPLTQGLFETTILRDLVSNPDPKDPNNRKYMNPRDMADREGMVDRGPRDEKLRKFGLRSLNEQKELDLVYKAKKKNTDSLEVGQNAMKEAYNAARLGNKEKAREYINLYVKLTGSQNPDIEALVKREFMTRAERAPETLTTPAGMKAVKIMNEILNESKQE